MAFWGTEVKPGKPFTHAPLNGRLHLSQATLGMGDGVQKSIVQCNVGNRMPVFLCSLFPDKAECCQLNLEFDESDEVVFSVIGPRTVHLTGYYMFSTSVHRHNDESESYGEDIAETETEKSRNSKDSEYGGSFIDDEDDDPRGFSSSEDFSAGPGSNEEMLGFKFKGHKGKPRRLRKKYQISESESSQQKDFTGGVASVELMNSEAEDTLPISSMFSGKRASNSGNNDMEGKARNETDNHNNNKTENDAIMLEGINGVQPECKSGIRNGDKLEELAKEERLEADHCMTEEVVLEQNGQNQKLPCNEKCQSDNLLLTSSQVGTEGGAKQNRKRKKHLQKKILEDDTKDDEVPKSGSNLNSVIEDVLMEDEEAQNQVNDDNHSKKRKKKKRGKDKAVGDATEMEPPVLSDHEKEQSVVEMKDKNTNDEEIQLSNGIIIEELETGKPDGKIASLGKKVRVNYSVKLKDSGELIDSSADKALLKFRLGEGKVQELWNVGLDGMRVGGKRRLTVPPSVSYTNEGTSENIPPNSWLVFDVELVKVR